MQAKSRTTTVSKAFPESPFISHAVIPRHKLFLTILLVIISKFPLKSTLRGCGGARMVRVWCVGGRLLWGGVAALNDIAVAKDYFKPRDGGVPAMPLARPTSQ